MFYKNVFNRKKNKKNQASQVRERNKDRQKHVTISVTDKVLQKKCYRKSVTEKGLQKQCYKISVTEKVLQKSVTEKVLQKKSYRKIITEGKIIAISRDLLFKSKKSLSDHKSNAKSLLRNYFVLYLNL